MFGDGDAGDLESAVGSVARLRGDCALHFEFVLALPVPPLLLLLLQPPFDL